MGQYHINQGSTSTLSVSSLIVSWNAWAADGSTSSFSYSCFHYLPWYGSECTCWSCGGAVAMHLQVHMPGQSWEDGEHALGLQRGHTCKILCAAWHKIHSLGQLEFFFSLAAKISPRVCDISQLTSGNQIHVSPTL